MGKDNDRQLDLGLISPGFRRREVYQARYERLLSHFRYIVDYHGADTVAEMLSAAQGRRRPRPSIIQAVHEDPRQRNRHRPYLEDLPVFLDADPSKSLGQLILTLDQDPEEDAEEMVVCMREAALRLYGREGETKLKRATRAVAEERRRRKFTK